MARHLTLAAKPLREAVSNEDNFTELMYRLGWRAESMPPEYEDLGSTVDAAVQALEALSEEPSLQEVLDLLGTARNVYRAVRTVSVAPPGVDAGPFLAEIGDRLFELLWTDYLAAELPMVYNVLKVLDVIVVENAPADAHHHAFIRTRFKWDEIPQIFGDPLSIFRRVYGWGEPHLKFNLILEHLAEILLALGLPVLIPASEENSVREYSGIFGRPLASKPAPLRIPFYYGRFAGRVLEASFVIMELPSSAGRLPGIVIEPRIPSELPASFPLSSATDVSIRAGSDIGSHFGILIRPGEVGVKYPFQPGTELPSAGFGLKIDHHPEAKTLLLGSRDGTRLEVAGAEAGVGVDYVSGELEFVLNAEARGLALVVAAGKGDGFLSELLGEGEKRIEMDLGTEWSSTRGLHFSGGGGFEVELPSHIQLGPILVEAVRIRLHAPPKSGPRLRAELGANITGKLGPLTATVQGIGLELDLLFEEGNAGPFDVSVGFRRPNGVGLSISGGGFTGGGFLSLNHQKGEYVGALEIDFNGRLSLKAVGVINTRLPDGSEGFSLLIVISAEFTPIQLGYGFTLNGVGGILGLNRSIAVAAIADGIRTNSIKSILFPEDLVANISRIVSDIKPFFPPRQDHFVIGPMAKLGWGPFITLELGLLLDLPNPMFAIVGVLRAILPKDDAPVLQLQANFIGIVDFDQGYAFFRSDLFESRLLVYTITGSSAFLASWGEQKTIALSVGGFHPDFRDIPSIPALPDGFRNMARIGLSLLSGDNPRLKVEAYFAVTSNTAQLGARVELYASAAGFNIYGFLGFDVLFQFDPFRFIAKLQGGVALRRNTTTIASVNVAATLTGTSPFDVQGKASLSFLFFSVSVPFHHTWGDPLTAILEAVEDLLGLLQRELKDVRNWTAELPPNNHLRVTLREFKPPTGEQLLVIHPAGVVTFSQKSLPLEAFEIEKFGNKKPLAGNRFQLSNINSNGKEITADFQSVKEQFAPVNFTNLTDSQKLSRPSFENLPSGFRLSSTNDLVVARPVSREVVYELSYLKKKANSVKGLASLVVRSYDRLVKGSSVRKSTLSKQQNRASMNAPKQVFLPGEAFVITNIADLKPFADAGGTRINFGSYAEAYQRQQEILRRDPKLAGKIQVVSSYEVNRN